MDSELENRFTYHPPTPDSVPKYTEIRNSAKALAEVIYTLCPPSREKALAFTKLEEAVMWANAAIARNQKHE